MKKTDMKTFLYSVVAIAALFFLQSCLNNYYKAKAVSPRAEYPAAIEKAKAEKRYFVLHSGINIYSVTTVDVDTTKQQFTVQLEKVDSQHMVYLQNPNAKRFRSGKVDPPLFPGILVHMSDSTSYTLDEPHTLLMNKVARIDLVD